VPFLLVSATTWDDGAGREAAEKGADLFLMRPIDPQRLLEHIRKLLGKRR
jgi:DNA-binding response OmpR family regulator